MAQDKNSDADKEQLMLLINDILERLTAFNLLLKDIQTSVDKSHEEKQKDNAPTFMETVLKEQVKIEFATIKKMLAELIQNSATRPSVRTWRLQLFSTRENAKLFYRYFLIGLGLALCLHFGYRFAIHTNDNRHALDTQQWQYKNAEKSRE